MLSRPPLTPNMKAHLKSQGLRSLAETPTTCSQAISFRDTILSNSYLNVFPIRKSSCANNTKFRDPPSLAWAKIQWAGLYAKILLLLRPKSKAYGHDGRESLERGQKAKSAMPPSSKLHLRPEKLQNEDIRSVLLFSASFPKALSKLKKSRSKHSGRWSGF
jgi:hypothetical protein